MARAGDGKARSDRRLATARLSKRVTPAQLADFERRAREAGFKSGQEYLSAFVVGAVQMTVEHRKIGIKALGELGKIGSNINQIAKACNEGRVKHIDPVTAQELSDATIMIEKLGQEIRDSLR